MSRKRLLRFIARIRGYPHEDELRRFLGLETANAVRDFTDSALKRLLLHCYHHVPYYRSVLERSGGVVNGPSVDLARFQELPLLTKEILRSGSGVESDERHERRCYENCSGGSTGEPVRLIQDNVFRRWAKAAEEYFYRALLRVDSSEIRKVVLWGSERDLFQGGIGIKAHLVNRLRQVRFLNSFRMTEADMDRYVAQINRYRPDLIRGYAGSLRQISLRARSTGVVLHSPQRIVSSAETLTPDMRDDVERAFQAPVHDFYGSREVPNLAGECDYGLLHGFRFFNLIEVLDEFNQPVSAGHEGRVVVTNLFNYSMPLVRFDLGDLAVQGPDHCPCGNPLPTLIRVTGRITDHFMRSNGTRVHGEYFTHLFYLKDWVRKFQVVQTEYDCIELLVVVEKPPSDEEKSTIENHIRLAMGPECRVVWRFVDDISETGSGKYRYTRSLVGDNA